MYILDKLSVLLRKQNVGLCWDDGLDVVKNINGPKLGKLRREIIAIFKAEYLSITIETNLIETDFWDVTFNLHTGKYFPYLKPSNDPFYIKINQTTQIPSGKSSLGWLMNFKMISELSCNKEEFVKAKGIYEKAISESKIKVTLKFNEL